VREGPAHAREAAADPQVEAVDGAGPDLDDGLAGAGGRFGQVGALEDAGVAVAAEDDGSHDRFAGGRGDRSGGTGRNGQEKKDRMKGTG
jgi:hypothetical protein